MWANNETGVIFPVEEIARAAHAQGAYFHTDAVQAVGKVPVRLENSAIHYLSLAGHKLHAPKGVGALYVHRRARFTPFLVGGGQEGGRRGGTENVAGIVALGKAAELAGAHMAEEQTAVRQLRDNFESWRGYPARRLTEAGRPSGCPTQRVSTSLVSRAKECSCCWTRQVCALARGARARLVRCTRRMY